MVVSKIWALAERGVRLGHHERGTDMDSTPPAMAMSAWPTRIARAAAHGIEARSAKAVDGEAPER